MNISLGRWSSLPGPRQTVVRGELYCLWVSIRESEGHIISTTDNSTVCSGLYESRWIAPSGPDADLWYRIGRELERKPSMHGTVF
eukprot:2784839-Pyramimonas_sp.AAC.1